MSVHVAVYLLSLSPSYNTDIGFLDLITAATTLVFSYALISRSLVHQVCLSVNLQKLTSDLAGVEQQKKVLEMELEQWRQITFPQQTAPPPPPPECSCQGKTIPAPPNPAPQALEAEVKQLQAKLKVSWCKLQTEQQS